MHPTIRSRVRVLHPNPASHHRRNVTGSDSLRSAVTHQGAFYTTQQENKTDNPPLRCSCRGVDRAASALALIFRLCNNFSRRIHRECPSCQLDHSGQMIDSILVNANSDKVPDNASRAGRATQTQLYIPVGEI